VGQKHAESNAGAAGIGWKKPKELGQHFGDRLIEIKLAAVVQQNAGGGGGEDLGDRGKVKDGIGINGPGTARISEMPEAGKADQLALMGDGGDSAGERMLGDAGAKNAKRVMKPGGL
jgi:hypothetical protein